MDQLHARKRIGDALPFSPHRWKILMNAIVREPATIGRASVEKPVMKVPLFIYVDEW